MYFHRPMQEHISMCLYKVASICQRCWKITSVDRLLHSPRALEVHVLQGANESPSKRKRYYPFQWGCWLCRSKSKWHSQRAGGEGTLRNEDVQRCYTLELACSGRRQASWRYSHTHPCPEGRDLKPERQPLLWSAGNSHLSISNVLGVQGGGSRGRTPMWKGRGGRDPGRQEDGGVCQQGPDLVWSWLLEQEVAKWVKAHSLWGHTDLV